LFIRGLLFYWIGGFLVRLCKGLIRNFKNLSEVLLSELDDVHNIINWSEIEQTLSNLYSSKTGASAYPPIMMFKILILQA
jgi:hypothetical protein